MRFFTICMILALGWSCNKPSNTKEFEPKFVVEGWIENGGYPVVKLTHNLPIDAVLDSAQMEEIIIRWAKVEVVATDETEVLTLVRDEAIFPHYIYKGARVKGKTGEKYQLIVTYAGNVLTAETTVPELPVIDAVAFTTMGENQYQLKLSFTDDERTRDYYRFYAKLDSVNQFSSTTPGGFNDLLFNGQSVSFQLFRNRYSNVSKYVSAYFGLNDTIDVRLSKMDSISFAYWSSINRVAGNIPFLTGSGVIGSNIKGPGTGIWYGIANDTRKVIVK